MAPLPPRSLRVLSVAAVLVQVSDAVIQSTALKSQFGRHASQKSDQAWVETHGTEIARQHEMSENAKAAESIEEALAEGPRVKAKCVRFLLLTTQKAGGTWLMEELPHVLPAQMRTGRDVFNWRDGKTGSRMLKLAGFVSDYQGDGVRRKVMSRLGPRIWAEHAWALIENATHKQDKTGLETLESSCATGFELLGPEADSWTTPEMSSLFSDHRVKKVVLERGDAYDQWISRQFGCMLQYTNNRRQDADFDWYAWTEERVKAGSNCKVGQIADFANYSQFQKRLYQSWRNALKQSNQRWLELRTESLSHNLTDSPTLRTIKKFLFGGKSRGTGEKTKPEPAARKRESGNPMSRRTRRDTKPVTAAKRESTSKSVKRARKEQEPIAAKHESASTMSKRIHENTKPAMAAKHESVDPTSRRTTKSAEALSAAKMSAFRQAPRPSEDTKPEPMAPQREAKDSNVHGKASKLQGSKDSKVHRKQKKAAERHMQSELGKQKVEDEAPSAFDPDLAAILAFEADHVGHELKFSDLETNEEPDEKQAEADADEDNGMDHVGHDSQLSDFDTNEEPDEEHAEADAGEDDDMELALDAVIQNDLDMEADDEWRSGDAWK